MSQTLALVSADPIEVGRSNVAIEHMVRDRVEGAARLLLLRWIVEGSRVAAKNSREPSASWPPDCRTLVPVIPTLARIRLETKSSQDWPPTASITCPATR